MSLKNFNFNESVLSNTILYHIFNGFNSVSCLQDMDDDPIEMKYLFKYKDNICEQITRIHLTPDNFVKMRESLFLKKSEKEIAIRKYLSNPGGSLSKPDMNVGVFTINWKRVLSFNEFSDLDKGDDLFYPYYICMDNVFIETESFNVKSVIIDNIKLSWFQDSLEVKRKGADGPLIIELSDVVLEQNFDNEVKLKSFNIEDLVWSHTDCDERYNKYNEYVKIMAKMANAIKNYDLNVNILAMESSDVFETNEDKVTFFSLINS